MLSDCCERSCLSAVVASKSFPSATRPIAGQLTRPCHPGDLGIKVGFEIECRALLAPTDGLASMIDVVELCGGLFEVAFG